MPNAGECGCAEKVVSSNRGDLLELCVLFRRGQASVRYRINHTFRLLIALLTSAGGPVAKSSAVTCHLMCIARKLVRGRDCRWHWEHILREFGAGRYKRMSRRD